MFDSNLKNAVFAGVLASTAVYAGLHYFGGDGEGMKLDEANLKLIQTLKNKFKCQVGYSGHETGSYLVCITASLLGATSIERHITLDRTMYGSDQSASLEPEGLFRMVRDLRTIDKIQGDGKKRIWDSEIPAMKKLREVFV